MFPYRFGNHNLIGVLRPILLKEKSGAIFGTKNCTTNRQKTSEIIPRFWGVFLTICGMILWFDNNWRQHSVAAASTAPSCRPLPPPTVTGKCHPSTHLSLMTPPMIPPLAPLPHDCSRCHNVKIAGLTRWYGTTVGTVMCDTALTSSHLFIPFFNTSREGLHHVAIMYEDGISTNRII